MSKREGSFQSAIPSYPVSKKKRVSLPLNEQKLGSMDCSSPEAMMQSLLGTTKAEDFFQQYWEKKPLFVKRSDAKFYGDFFTLAMFKEVVQANTLNVPWGVNVSTYEDGEKKDLGAQCQEGPVTVEMIDKVMDEKKATVRFDQPQRYIDVQWKVLEKLESFFGMLVGAEGYITPPGCQGYAPHCDDTESFILQTEGKQEWKVYKPIVELCSDFTQDLPEDLIGEPIFQSVLEASDLLYIPRGCIYVSKAESSSHSTHVVYSTYEQSSLGDFMNHALSQAIENAIEDDAFFRAGLPINYRSFLGTAKNMGEYVAEEEEEEESEKKDKEDVVPKEGDEKEAVEDEGKNGKEDASPVPTEGDEKDALKKGSKEVEVQAFPSNLSQIKVIAFKERIQSALTKLSDYIDVNKAADTMCSSFMWSRLPPYGYVPKAITELNTSLGETKVDGGEDKGVEKTKAVDEKSIQMEDKIKIKYPDHFRVMYCNDEEDDDDLDDESDIESQTENEQSAASDIGDEDDTEKAENMEVKKDEQVEVDGKEKTENMDAKKDENEVEESKVKSPIKNDDDDDEDTDAIIPDTQPHLKVLHSLHNDRFFHMAFDTSSCIKFDVAFSKALIQMTEKNEYVLVRDLLLDTEVEKLDLANKLFAQGLLDVQSH